MVAIGLAVAIGLVVVRATEPPGKSSTQPAGPDASLAPSANPSASASASASGAPKSHGAGPVLSITGDFPYTLQGIAAGKVTTAAGTPAPAGYKFLYLAIEIRGKLTDRSMPAPTPGLSVSWPQCENAKSTQRPVGCAVQSPMKRLWKYMPIEIFDRDHLTPPESSEMLPPGPYYYTYMSARIPDSVDPKQSKVCTIVPVGQTPQCIPLATLPISSD
ncbi:hypothetical protein ACRB68_42080 [Actinomadura sp. RB68]|uniref:Uncharacterized protein n=1 Tax=Actinomadura macrotermitis TaxID=2585200 RepID=A0A7K0BY69_9ACTN|nr:hypothetical protein [Actinomadura macrotermitis]